MSSETNVGIKINLPEWGIELDFENPSKLIDWGNTTTAEWTWLRSTPVKPLFEKLRSFLNGVTHAGHQWAEHPSNEIRKKNAHLQAEGALRTLYSTAPTSFFRDKEAVSFVTELIKSAGNHVAAGAIAVVAKAPVECGNDVPSEFFVGMIHGFLYQNDIKWSASAHRKTLVDLEERYKTLLKEQETRLKALEGENKKLNVAFANELKAKSAKLSDLHEAKGEELDQLLKAKSANFDTLHAEKDTQFSDLAKTHEENFKATEETFHNKLALQKPVDYWVKKKEQHTKLTVRFAWASGIVLTLAVIWLILVALWAFGSLEPKESPEAWRVGVAVISAFFAIWIVRILVRLFLSHQHLATDASERVTMVQTFLSLSLETKNFTDADRAVILQQLFRNASDGIVKDDAAPPNVLELLSRQK